MKGYIRSSISILKQLYIWDNLTANERNTLRSCTTDIQVDRLMRTFRERYM